MFRWGLVADTNLDRRCPLPEQSDEWAVPARPLQGVGTHRAEGRRCRHQLARRGILIRQPRAEVHGDDPRQLPPGGTASAFLWKIFVQEVSRFLFNVDPGPGCRRAGVFHADLWRLSLGDAASLYGIWTGVLPPFDGSARKIRTEAASAPRWNAASY
ncbi:hypothetical protein SDC9_06489 [bioreactor metagenome]|uniref:Uncharacterized protein n=1 Tax=bioreactor metagenome TaxID=1076179 RepID=A0A644T1Z7_9ZZZZ